jgi:hypothetical protein
METEGGEKLVAGLTEGKIQRKAKSIGSLCQRYGKQLGDGVARLREGPGVTIGCSLVCGKYRGLDVAPGKFM